MIASLTDGDLLAFLHEAKILTGLEGATLKALPVNYTSRFWRLETGQRIYVIKEFYPGLEDNPLYPTLPDHEAAALIDLERQALAPRLEAYCQSPQGHPLLIYGYAPAAEDDVPLDAATALIARLSAVGLPSGGYRPVPMGGAAVLRHGDAFLSLIAGCAKAVNLARLRPDHTAGIPGPGQPSLVHRSLSPGTLQATARGVRLIDWQYSGLGDPIEDLAGFLSPGLTTLYGMRPLVTDAENLFFDYYPHRDILDRFHRLRAAYHWRLAAYCLYRQETLSASNPPAARAYGRALEEEVDLLLRLRGR
ncbi:MAG: phosphotransferase [Roseibium sp.]|nr:phosphotransferase [Roseibium sp.]